MLILSEGKFEGNNAITTESMESQRTVAGIHKDTGSHGKHTNTPFSPHHLFGKDEKTNTQEDIQLTPNTAYAIHISKVVT